MGAGKSTIGVLLAEHLDQPFYDSDDLLAKATGRTAAQIADDEGLAALHAIEARVVLEALDRQEPAVIAVAASVVEDKAVRAVLARHTCLWFDADAATLAARQERGDHRRSLGDPSAALGELKRHRDPVYAELALVRIDTAITDPDAALAAALGAAGSRSRPA